MSQQYSFNIVEAKKQQGKARMALCGPAGSGKTYTALLVAQAWAMMIAEERGIDVSEVKLGGIDTEHHSMRLYSEESWIVTPFFVIELDPPFELERCEAAIHALEAWGADVIIFDSISHAWAGEGGALSSVDDNAAKYGGNKYAAWRNVTPKHNSFVDAMTRCKAHFIACARSKMEYVLDDVNGKKVPRKVGMAPVQRDGMEYEFDVVGDLTIEHTLDIAKTRCGPLDGKLIKRPGAELAKIVFDWLGAGAPPPPMLSEQQEAHVLYLFGQLMPQLDTDNRLAVNQVLATRGYPPLHRVPATQAVELIGVLEAKAKEAEKKPAEQPEPPPESGLEPPPELEPEATVDEQPEPATSPPTAAPPKAKKADSGDGKPWTQTTKVGELAKNAAIQFSFKMADIVAALNEAEPDREVENLTQTTLTYEQAWKAIEDKAAKLAVAA